MNSNTKNENKVHLHINLTNEELNVAISAFLYHITKGKDDIPPKQRSLLLNMIEYFEEIDKE